MYDDYLLPSHSCLGDQSLDRLHGPKSLESAMNVVASSIADSGVNMKERGGGYLQYLGTGEAWTSGRGSVRGGGGGGG